MESMYNSVKARARVISYHGSIEAAVNEKELEQFQDITVSEALILGLFNQGIRKYIAVFGHGSTDISNILAVYEEEGLVKTFNVRNEIEGSHCATMLKWHYGETAAVVTSIGPGALQAYAASIAPASNGIGIYHIYGDETTHEEGFNMQQIPKMQQGNFLNLAKTMWNGYNLHTPEAIFSALRWGGSTVFHPTNAGPFFMLMPMNIQPETIQNCNLLELPVRPQFNVTMCADKERYKKATQLVSTASKITIKFGGGAGHAGEEIVALAEKIGAVIVSGAKMSGTVPYSQPRYMGVGGSKGSICGNYAMNNAELVIALGARSVCQWDCSGTAFKHAGNIINFNADPGHANHYNRSVLIVGDVKENLRNWLNYLQEENFTKQKESDKWLEENIKKKAEWELFKQKRYANPVLDDKGWRSPVLTQPAAIKIAYDFARKKGATCYFDAGDVQANGFQIVEDEYPGKTFNETGASYMGFAISSLLAGAVAENPEYTFAFTGDGSFTMNPQVLFDGVEHKLRGCIIIFDNRKMAAISGLQQEQFNREYKTADTVKTDYVSLCSSVEGVKGFWGGKTTDDFLKALKKAYDYVGLSVIHVPVYYGSHELGNLGVFGNWNVGNWCSQVQKKHHRLGL